MAELNLAPSSVANCLPSELTTQKEGGSIALIIGSTHFRHLTSPTWMPRSRTSKVKRCLAYCRSHRLPRPRKSLVDLKANSGSSQDTFSDDVVLSC